MARLEGFGQPCMLKRHKAAESGSFKARIRSTWRNALRPGASGSGAGACGPEASATAARAGEREAHVLQDFRMNSAPLELFPNRSRASLCLVQCLCRRDLSELTVCPILQS